MTKSVPPTRPLAAALIGCGTAGRAVAIAAAALPHMAIRRYVDVDESAAAELAHAFGSGDATMHQDEAFLRDDVEAVIIATPYASHAEMTARAAQHRKHVFVPPPFALRSAHAERLRGQIEAAPVVCCVDFGLRTTPAVALVKAQIPQPSLITIQAATDSLAGVWPGEAEHGGVMAHLGHRALDLACHLAASQPARVFASGGRYVRRAGLPDTFFAVIRFANQAVAQVAIGEFGRTRTLSGLWGTVSDGSRTAILWDEARRAEVRDGQRLVTDTGDDRPHGTTHGSMLAAFGLAVREGGKAPAGPADGARAVTLADAVYESMRIGRTVSLS